MLNSSVYICIMFIPKCALWLVAGRYLHLFFFYRSELCQVRSCREKMRVMIRHTRLLRRRRQRRSRRASYVRVPAELSTASPFLGYTRSELSFTFSVFDATLRGHREVGRVSSSVHRRCRCIHRHRDGG